MGGRGISPGGESHPPPTSPHSPPSPAEAATAGTADRRPTDRRSEGKGRRGEKEDPGSGELGPRPRPAFGGAGRCGEASGAGRPPRPVRRGRTGGGPAQGDGGEERRGCRARGGEKAPRRCGERAAPPGRDARSSAGRAPPARAVTGARARRPRRAAPGAVFSSHPDAALRAFPAPSPCRAPPISLSSLWGDGRAAVGKGRVAPQPAPAEAGVGAGGAERANGAGRAETPRAPARPDGPGTRRAPAPTDLGFPGAARRVMGITPPDRQSASFMVGTTTGPAPPFQTRPRVGVARAARGTGNSAGADPPPRPAPPPADRSRGERDRPPARSAPKGARSGSEPGSDASPRRAARKAPDVLEETATRRGGRSPDTEAPPAFRPGAARSAAGGGTTKERRAHARKGLSVPRPRPHRRKAAAEAAAGPHGHASWDNRHGNPAAAEEERGGCRHPPARQRLRNETEAARGAVRACEKAPPTTPRATGFRPPRSDRLPPSRQPRQPGQARHHGPPGPSGSIAPVTTRREGGAPPPRPRRISGHSVGFGVRRAEAARPPRPAASHAEKLGPLRGLPGLRPRKGVSNNARLREGGRAGCRHPAHPSPLVGRLPSPSPWSNRAGRGKAARPTARPRGTSDTDDTRWAKQVGRREERGGATSASRARPRGSRERPGEKRPRRPRHRRAPVSRTLRRAVGSRPQRARPAGKERTRGQGGAPA
ncbi:collagen alpha-1(I) chain-like [Chamaea fasciata]|uniref:collagen alpha-1(I) chain-like n=1 Tax=Chamaea fasciata TaxID=190680 RepID=UPI003369D5B6